MPEREHRTYTTTDIPTLIHTTEPASKEALLLAMYKEACSTWRMLVDVRFKLFALVPTASLLSLATVLGDGGPTKSLPLKLRILFSTLGLAVTLGLLIYELRNSQLHDDLISRGRKIETELGIDTAIFRGRPSAKGLLKHDNATRLIYGSAILAWIAALWSSTCSA